MTPPETGTTADYVAWLEGLIGADLLDPDEDEGGGTDAYTLNIPACSRAGADADVVARDLAALQAVKSDFARLADGAGTRRSLGYDHRHELDRRTFVRDLTTAINAAQSGAARRARDGCWSRQSPMRAVCRIDMFSSPA